MRNTFSGLYLAGLLLVHGGIAAQEPATPLEPMVISATRWETVGVPTATSITVITREEIIESGASRIVDVLRGRGGVQIRDFYGDGSRARVDMRGFGDTAGSNTLILVDGRRLNNTDLHDPDLNFISIKDVERIEIIQGSASVLYGDQAVGGVINVITRQAGEFEADIQAGYGSYDRQFQILQLAGRLENGTSARLTAERRLADNYRDNNNLDYINGLFRLDHDWDRGNVFATLQRTDEKLGIPGDLLISQLKISRTQSDTPQDLNDTTSKIFHGGGLFSVTPAWDVLAEFTHRDEDVKAIVTLGGMPFNLKQKRLHKSFNPRLRGRLEFEGKELFLTAGMDLENTDYSLAGFTNSTQELGGLYALGIIAINNKVDLTAGFRTTWVENDIVDGFSAPTGTLLEDNQTLSSAGVIFRPMGNMRVFLKREDTFRFPLIDEQTSVIGFQAPLKTQTGVSYESGLEWFNDRISAKLAGYLLQLENEIIFDPGTFTNSNLDPTERKGLILETVLSLPRHISLDAQYTYTDARFDAGPFAGNRIPLVSEHQLHIGLNWAFAPDWGLYGDMLFISDKIAGNDFADQYPDVHGYGVSNINLRFDNGRYSFSAGINNVLDAQYRESAAVNFLGQVGYFPAPERNFIAAFEYVFQ